MSPTPAPSPAPSLLTDAEHRAMELTADLYSLIARDIIGSADTRPGDVAELVIHIHAIQHTILAQAAARAYPYTYRLLGGQALVDVVANS